MSASLVSRVVALAAGLPSIVRFGMVGGTGLVTDTCVFTALSLAGMNPLIARVFSLAVATLVTWTLNRHFTFDRRERQVGNEVSRYVTVTVVAQGLSFAVFGTLITIFPYLIHQIALVAGAVVGALFSFNGHKFVSFGPVASKVS
jgi:putative flippase GtrA